MKKRLLALALALVMACAVAVPASAAMSYYEASLRGMMDYFRGIGDMESYNKTMKELEEYLANNADQKNENTTPTTKPETSGTPTVTEIVPPKYGEAKDFSETSETPTVTEIVPPKYDEVKDFSEGLAAVELDGKWGFIDKTGKEVVPCKYNGGAGDFDQGLATVGMGQEYSISKLGLIDKTGKEVAPCKYAYVSAFDQGLAAVKLYGGDYCGFIDTTGKEVVPCTLEYFSVGEIHDGLAAVRVSNWPSAGVGYKYGFIDTTGKEIVPCKYDEVKDFSEGLAAVRLEGKGWGFIDTTGKEIIPCKYNNSGYYSAPVFHEGLAAVHIGDWSIGEWGFIDKSGAEVVPCKYYKVEDFDQGLAAVCVGDFNNEKWGFIDKTGKEVVPCKYGRVQDFSEGLAAVELNGKWGFVDITGKEVVPCTLEYDRVGNFSEGLAAVAVDSGERTDNRTVIDKYGFIDKTGKEVVPCKYYKVEDFGQGLAAVRDGNRMWGFIDKTGKEVVPCKYDYPRDDGYETGHDGPAFREGLAAVCVRDYATGKWGFLAIDNSDDTPAPAPATTAYASTQTVTVDGKPVTFYAYALKDANGNDTNYIKLRDVAQILNGSAAQFQVGWDGSITITTKTAYTPNGSEMVQNFTGNQSYTVSTNPVTVNGRPTNLEAITLTDGKGGGYNYFKLRDLGAALGFNVTWSADTGISIDPNSPYNANK